MSALAKLGIRQWPSSLWAERRESLACTTLPTKSAQKYHEVSDEIRRIRFPFRHDVRREGSGRGEAKDWALSGNRHHWGMCAACSSKQDVSKAVGVEIVRTESGKDNGCSYMAKGTQQDMTAKHLKAMVADNGADKKTQEIAETIAGGMFTAFQAERPAAEQDNSGEVPVFTVLPRSARRRRTDATQRQSIGQSGAPTRTSGHWRPGVCIGGWNGDCPQGKDVDSNYVHHLPLRR